MTSIPNHIFEQELAETVHMLLETSDQPYLQRLSRDKLCDALDNELQFIGFYDRNDNVSHERVQTYLHDNYDFWIDQYIQSNTPPTSSKGGARFVGRHRERDTLYHSLVKARTGAGQVVAISGKPGMGKSRLIYEFIRYSRIIEDWLVLKSTSVSAGQAKIYAPVTNLLKRYFSIQDSDHHPSVCAKVKSKVLTLDASLEENIPPLLALLDALPRNAPFWNLDPLVRRQLTLTSLRDLLLYESKRQPLLLVFEDLHWIDSETQALLDSLVESLSTYNILFVASYRPEYQHSWSNKSYYTLLPLEPLSDTETDKLLQFFLGSSSSLARLKQVLIDQNEGNPFYLQVSVQEIVRMLKANQTLSGEPGDYHISSDIEDIQILPTASDALKAQINRLSAKDKSLLQQAAVIGVEIAFPLLRKITDFSEEELYCGLERLQAADLLDETSPTMQSTYTFKHALIQEAVYQSIDDHIRVQHHYKIAQTLVQHFDEIVENQPELLAHHYTKADLKKRAIM